MMLVSQRYIEVLNMSFSIDLAGRTMDDMREVIVHHISRQSEKEGLEVAEHTDSHIMPKLTSYNIRLVHEPDLMKHLKQEVKAYEKAEGTKFKSNRNAFLTGNITLSFESLTALGWKYAENEDGELQALPSDKQSSEAIKNVKLAYTDLVQSAQRQSERYGKIRECAIHFDETSPHVDFIASGLDVKIMNRDIRTILRGTTKEEERYNQTLNNEARKKSKELGKKIKVDKSLIRGLTKGEAGRAMQDHLADFSNFDLKTRQKFDLVRGISKKERVKTKATNAGLKRMNGKLKSENADILTQAKEIKQSQEMFVVMVEGIKERETQQNRREQDLEQHEMKLIHIKKRLSDEQSKLEELRKKVLEMFNELLEMAKSKFEIKKRVRELSETYSPVTDENLDDFVLALSDLSSEFDSKPMQKASELVL